MNQDMIYKTAQDMKKDMILHTSNEGAVRLRRSRVLLRAYSSAPGGVLRTILLLLMMTVGVNGAWGQETTDYSGIYYIGSNGYKAANTTTNFYLCPTVGYKYYDSANSTYTNENNGQPFLTTYQCRGTDGYDSQEALWIIEKHPNQEYYYIKHASDNKYLTYNPAIFSNLGRVRVHLEDSPVEDAALFSIEYVSSKSSFDIKSKKAIDNSTYNGDRIFLNVNKGNKQSLVGDGDAFNGINTGGIIGLWTSGSASETNGMFYLEDYIQKPTIFYNTGNQIEITVQDDATIIYTTDGSDPKDPTNSNRTVVNSNTTTFPIDEIKTIKAVAVVSGFLSKEITTFTPPVLCGETYLIQSQNNAWDTDKFHFYMIPGDLDGNVKVNTTSLFRPSMEWYFAGAGMENGIQFYYIINNSNSKYLCYASSTVFMDDFSNDNKLKFRIVESPVSGTFNIIPYELRNATGNTNRFVNKNTDNANANPINLANNGNTNNTRWKFVTKSALDQTAPFTVSTASSSRFYKIANVGSSDYYIVPPSSGDWVTTSNSSDANVEKSGTWYFEEAQAATDDDWCTYYHIRNAETGNYLYFTQNGVSSSACFKLNNTIPNGDEDRYMFTWARTATENTYYIIPKYLKDAKLNTISTLDRNNTTLRTVSVRTAGNAAWTFTPAELFCNDPVFEEEGGVIKIKCNTNAAKIYINTESDADPTNEFTPYDPTQVTTQNWPTNDQVRIKAIAIVSDGTNTASSAVITLLNNPDVTLEAGPYIYKAEAWVPDVTVSIGEEGNATTATSGTYTTTYANNINAGTASVTITDAVDTDVLFIRNVAVKEFTIDKKDLTITANPKTIGYGDEADNDGVTYGEFAGSETETVLGGTLGYSYTTKGDDPQPYVPFESPNGNTGEYYIKPSGLTSTNYAITFVPGTLTVTKKSFGEGSLAEGFTLNFDESGEVVLKYGTHALTKDVDYTISTDTEHTNAKYASRTILGTGNDDGTGNYTGNLTFRNAIVHFTTDADQEEWSATFVAESSGADDIGHALPEGISAYIISNISGETAIAEPLDYIPANVPVLLVAQEETNGFLVTDANSESVTEITPTQIGYNKLKEVTAGPTHFDTRQIYVLYNNEFVLNKAGDLAQGKVYMENPNYSAASPARLTILRRNVTGIKDIQINGVVERTTGRWYTMDGRRLSGKPNAKGLYILNGKKIVVK